MRLITARGSVLGMFACSAVLSVMLVAQSASPPTELPPAAVAQLATSLQASKPFAKNVWRDTAPFNADGTVNAYIEIARGDRRKWEFSMAKNQRVIDRMMPEHLGGYPVNYGIVPQTVSYDGDPFDALVVGPPIEGGTLVRGVIVGLMLMEDEKGWDAKVVLSVPTRDGKPRDALTAGHRDEMTAFFRRYKEHEPGKYSKVPGWGSIAEGLAHVKITHAFFRECRGATSAPCRAKG